MASAISVRAWTRFGSFLGTIAVAAVSGVVGAAVAALAAHSGDLGAAMIVAVPLLLLVVVAIFADLRVGVLVTLAAFPFGGLGVELGLVDVQFVEAASFVVAGLVFLRRLAARLSPFRWSPAMSWTIALVGWCLVAVPSALDQAAAFKQTAALIGGILFALVVISACSRIEDVRFVIGSFVAVAAIVGIFSVLTAGDLKATLGGTGATGRSQGPFAQPNELGAFCAMAAAVAAGMVFGGRTRRGRLASLATLGILFVGLLLSLSRGAWLGFGMAIVYLIVALPQARRAIAAFGIPMIVAGAFLGAFAPENPQLQVVGARVRAFNVLSPYDGRAAIWAEARREILEDPLTGQGPGSFPVASARSGSQSATVRAVHAHNLVLNWGAEVGLPAVAIIIGFAVTLGYQARRAAKEMVRRGSPEDRALIAGLQAALIAMLGQGLVDYPLRHAVIFLTVWFVIGALLAFVQVVGSPVAD